MNKAELISAISAETQMTKTAVEKVINAYIRVVTDELAQGGVVNMSGFGNFSVADRAARTGRNPLTGEAVHIPVRRASRPARRSRTPFADRIHYGRPSTKRHPIRVDSGE